MGGRVVAEVRLLSLFSPPSAPLLRAGHAAVDAFSKGLADLEDVATHIGAVFDAALEAHDAASS